MTRSIHDVVTENNIQNLNKITDEEKDKIYTAIFKVKELTQYVLKYANHLDNKKSRELLLFYTDSIYDFSIDIIDKYPYSVRSNCILYNKLIWSTLEKTHCEEWILDFSNNEVKEFIRMMHWKINRKLQDIKKESLV